jgi:hypothetical protein
MRTHGMKHSHRLPLSPDPLPPRFLSCHAAFADLFTRPTWPNVLLILAGVILAPGRRTGTAALRILGRDRDPKFCTFHRVLNRAAWSSRAAASRLLLLLIASFLPDAAPAIGSRDPAPVVRHGHPAHHARPARPVLHHHVIRPRSRQVPETEDQNRRMVSKGPPDLQRRHRGGAPRNMGASDFFHVAAAPRPYRNSAAYLPTYAKRTRVRRLELAKVERLSLASSVRVHLNRAA